MDFAIEKGIPIPPRTNNSPSRKGESKYPFMKMEADDSVFFKLPGGNHTKRALQKIMSGVARARKEVPGSDFVMRRVEGGARIWRLK